MQLVEKIRLCIIVYLYITPPITGLQGQDPDLCSFFNQPQLAGKLFEIKKLLKLLKKIGAEKLLLFFCIVCTNILCHLWTIHSLLYRMRNT